jgi:hypothetical protein
VAKALDLVASLLSIRSKVRISHVHLQIILYSHARDEANSYLISAYGSVSALHKYLCINKNSFVL